VHSPLQRLWRHGDAQGGNDCVDCAKGMLCQYWWYIIDCHGQQILSPMPPGKLRRAFADRMYQIRVLSPTMDIYKCLFWKQATESMSRKAHAWTHNYLTSTDGFSALSNFQWGQDRHHGLVVGHLQHRTTHRTPWPKSVVPIPGISIHILLSRRVKVDQSKVELS